MSSFVPADTALPEKIHPGLRPSSTGFAKDPEQVQPKAKSFKEDALLIPSLEGIRALSFLLVFLSHSGLGQILPGGFGVTIFFFLSGYLITTLLRIEFSKKGTIKLRNFYIRRAFRILPPFYLVLALATFFTLVKIIPGTLTFPAVASQVFYYNNFYAVFNSFDGQAPGTGIFWSLAVEEHFYLIFPVAYLLMQRFLPSRSRQALTLGAVCMLVLGWRFVLVYWLHSEENRTGFATDTRLDSILLGCILAIYANPMLDKSRISQKWWAFGLAPLGLAGLIFSLVFRDPIYRESFRYTLQGVCLFPIFIAAVRCPNWWPYRLLNLPWIRFMGNLSYSLYLVHFIYLSAISARTDWPQPIQGAVGLAFSIATATAIYYLVEKPSARLRRKLLVRLL